jgi:hypothetical protein
MESVWEATVPREKIAILKSRCQVISSPTFDGQIRLRVTSKGERPAAASLVLNVLLREKYLAYTVSICAGGGLFYLYGQGYRHWAYNPLLYQIWSYRDLTDSSQPIFWYGFYWLAIAMLCIVLAHLFYERKTNGRSKN